VWDFLSDAQHAGIPMVAQGQIVDEAPDTGFYQAPTLLRDVPVTHRLAQEEVFGPVLAAMASRTRTTRCNWPTPPSSGWSPASGRATARASSAWPSA
jgi:hypothetical protein